MSSLLRNTGQKSLTEFEAVLLTEFEAVLLTEFEAVLLTEFEAVLFPDCRTENRLRLVI